MGNRVRQYRMGNQVERESHTHSDITPAPLIKYQARHGEHLIVTLTC